MNTRKSLYKLIAAALSCVLMAGIMAGSVFADEEYHRTRATHVDVNGNVKYEMTYEYDAEGREIASYRDGIIKSSTEYHANGNIGLKKDYDNNGNIVQAETFDENGKVIEHIEYADNGTREVRYISYINDENGKCISEVGGLYPVKRYMFSDEGQLIRTETYADDTGSEVITSEVYELDEQGRPTACYVEKDDAKALYNSWTYNEDGTVTQTIYMYQKEGQLTPGEELINEVITVDAEGRILVREHYAPAEAESSERVLKQLQEYSYDDNGDCLTEHEVTYLEGTPSFEMMKEMVYISSGNLLNRNATYTSYTAEKEPHILAFCEFEAEYTDNLRVHSKAYACQDPYFDDNPVMTDEVFYSYQNAAGDVIEMKP